MRRDSPPFTIQLRDESLHLVEDASCFTGYRFSSLNNPDAGAVHDFGIPASIFEVELWKEIVRLRKVIARLKNNKEQESDNDKTQ